MGFFMLVVLVGIFAIMGIAGDSKKRSRRRDSSGYTYTGSHNDSHCSDSGFFGGGDSGGGDCGGGGGGD